jgi:hypothetical protein
MRKLFFFLICTVAMIACKQSVKGKNGVTYDSAVKYNDYIVERQTSLMKNVLEFGNMTDSEWDSAESYLRRYALQAEGMIRDIKGMPPYKGDSALRDAAVNSFTFYKKIFEQDYLDLVRIRMKGEDNITPEDVTEANRIVDKVGKEEEVFDDAFRRAQEDFADKNRMKLMDNKMQKEVDKMGND